MQVNEKNLDQVVKVVTHPASLSPWSPENAPIELQVPARRVNGWEIERPESLVSNFVKNTQTDNYMVTETITGNDRPLAWNTS